MQWKLLGVDDVVKQGDQWQDSAGAWHDSSAIGKTVRRCLGEYDFVKGYRRRVGEASSNDDLIRAVEMLLSSGKYFGGAKFEQWEEVELARELLKKFQPDEFDYIALTASDTIRAGDEFFDSREGRWFESVARNQLVSTQIGGSIQKYRHPIPRKNQLMLDFQDTFQTELIDVIKGLIYLGISEKYRDWEGSQSVLDALKLVAKIKGGEKHEQSG